MKRVAWNTERTITTGIILLTFILCSAFSGCVGLPVNKQTPTAAFVEASKAYANAWDVYHAAWLALPTTDARKAAWLKTYHPKFFKAATFLEKWGENFNDPTKAVDWDALLTTVQNILIELAIKKGGTL